jgi:hypothetical protein
MELFVKLAWLSLALIHVTPAAVFVVPDLAGRMYGQAASGPLGVLLTHRGALFLALLVAALYAMFDPHSRRLASIVLAISMLSFLYLYMRAGYPEGALRKIAWVDLLGLLPLIFVCFNAWTEARLN